MSAKQPVVEINGKRYNSVTGKQLKGPEGQSKATKKAPPKSIEGIVRTRQPVIPKMHKVAPQSRPLSAIKSPVPGAASLHHRTNRSKTLARTAVSPPAPPKKTYKPVASHRLQLDPSIRSFSNPEREIRAKSVHLHHLVNRFGLPVTASLGPEPAVLTPVNNPGLAPLAKTAKKVPAVIMPSTLVSSSHKQLNKMIARAMDNSESHKQKPHKHHKRRLVPLASLCLAALLLIGFYAYQNVPNAALQIAMQRSGVHASLPGYTPSGFAFSGPIRYNDGQLTINYSSKDNSGRSYDIKVKKTSWNNDALLSDFVQIGGRQYQIMQDSGKTIYIYDDQNATWLEQGSWYTIEGSGRLNSDQLVKIASSI